MRSDRALLLCLGVLPVSLACTRQEPALYASAADQPAFAERYPAGLGATRARYAEDERQLGTLTAEMPKLLDSLDKPSWGAVASVVDAADRAGKSGDLASAMGEAEAVRTFYAGERDALRQKVGGAAEYATKQKQCEVELYGPVGGALDRGVEAQLEERLRDHNAAHRLIEDQKDAIGKQNVDKLEKQADAIALASYLAHVRLPRTKRDLDAALADASDVKRTLEQEIEASKKVSNDPSASKAAKQTAEERQTAASTALASLDSEVSEAKRLADELEKRSAAARQSYEKAFDDLETAIEAKQKAEAKP